MILLRASAAPFGVGKTKINERAAAEIVCKPKSPLRGKCQRRLSATY